MPIIHTPRTVKMASTPVIPIKPSQDRIRFVEFNFTRTQSGQCSAEVILEFRGRSHVGRAIGPSSPLGDLRVSAEACVRALEDFSEAALHFELLGVKHVRAFDANLAIVSIAHREAQGMVRLVGCYLAADDVNRGSAIAVLNATNRVLAAERAAVDFKDIH
jgi:hypothetical protein